MRCLACHNPESRVLDSRPADDRFTIRRRRECTSCGHRFTTYEKLEPDVPVVVKRDGRREAFQRDKIMKGMVTACRKRPVAHSTLERVVDEIERDISSGLDREVDSRDIGNRVMEELRELDEVAYIRFASVYMNFKDLHRFREELDTLMSGGEAPREGELSC